MEVQDDSMSEEFYCSDCGYEISPGETQCPNCGSVFIEIEEGPNEEIEQGRNLSKLIIFFTLFSIFTTVIFDGLNFDFKSLSIFIFRLVLVSVLLITFYKGSKVSKNIMIGLFGLAGPIFIYFGILFLKAHWIGIIPIIIGLIYIMLSVLLIILKPIKYFQEYQRTVQKMSKEN